MLKETNYFRQFMITVIIISISSVLDSAIMIVKATSVWSSINFFPPSKSIPFLSGKFSVRLIIRNHLAKLIDTIIIYSISLYNVLF